MTPDDDLPDPAASLWDFAVSVYGRSGVSEAALALQDSYAADVPLILFCLWMPATEASQVMQKALQLSSQWQAGVVVPLRASRRALKSMVTDDEAAALRERVKAAELEAERLQLRALARLLSVNPRRSGFMPSRVTASHNLDTYFSTAKIQLDPLGKALVLRILDMAFDT